jgi:hypothetical protein
MAHRQTVAQTPDRGWKPLPVRPRGRLISTVQVRVGVSRSSGAEGNCVVARRGGEQQSSELSVCRMTNPFRRGVVASPLGGGEA